MDGCQCHTCGLTIPAQACTFCTVRVMLCMIEQMKIDRQIDRKFRSVTAVYATQRQRQRCTETATANGNGETATEERQRNSGNRALFSK